MYEHAVGVIGRPGWPEQATLQLKTSTALRVDQRSALTGHLVEYVSNPLQ
jgi:hypothetical protein